MRNGILLTPVALILGLSQTSAVGQAPIQFDAAAIKLDQRGPSDRRMRGGPGTSSPGRVTWQKVWLRDLMAVAFHIEPENVSGPDWISGNGAQLYLFTAIMPPDTSRQDFELMFQRLLIEQFRIELHHQTRMFPAYELVVATGGPRLKASADPNASAIPVYTAPKFDSGGFPVLPPGHGALVAFNRGYRGRFQSYTMSDFAKNLITWVTPPGDRTHYVVDKTGLTGAYDFTLKFDEDPGAIKLGPAVQEAAGATQDSDPTGLPNIFKALERQLGSSW